MGLAERRETESFKEKDFSGIVAEIAEVSGKDIEIEVDWDSLATEGDSHLYEESWNQVYFAPLVAALKNICADDIGKEALVKGLNKIVVKNTGENTNADAWASMDGSTLILDHKPTTNAHRGEDRMAVLQTTLENAL
jgi:hypothetical protein